MLTMNARNEPISRSFLNVCLGSVSKIRLCLDEWGLNMIEKKCRRSCMRQQVIYKKRTEINLGLLYASKTQKVLLLN